MPLQKPPPQHWCTTDKQPSVDPYIMRQRRRTLQTISELSPRYELHPRSTETTEIRREGLSNGTIGNGETKAIKNSRRRSMPIHGTTVTRGTRGTRDTRDTSIPLPTSSNLHRAKSDYRSSRNYGRRRSVPSSLYSLDSQGRSLSPVTEGEPLKRPISHSKLPMPEESTNWPHRRPSFTYLLGNSENVRDREVEGEKQMLKWERALLEANARRDVSVLATGTPSPPSILSRSTTPLLAESAGSHEILADTNSGYRSMMGMHASRYREDDGGKNSDPRKRQSRKGSMDRGALGDGTSGRRPSVYSGRYAQKRSECKGTEPPWVLYNKPSTHWVSAEGPLPSDHHVSSSQVSSKVCSVSSCRAIEMSHRRSVSSMRATGHPLRQNPISAREDIATTGANVEAFPGVIPDARLYGTTPGPSCQKAVYGSRRSATPQESRRPSTNQECSQSGSRKTHSARARSMAKDSDIIYRENPDKRGLMAPGSETARRMRQKRTEQATVEDEGELRQAKIKERVGRANELEEEKERGLLQQRPKTTMKRKKKRWCLLCGLISGG